MKDRAQLVVIGAGIVGASVAYHLARVGISDVVVLEQGPLIGTGGSSSHAPGLVFQTNGSRTMCRLAQYSVELYRQLSFQGVPAWNGVGGIEVATTPERIQELRRRRGYARAYGIDETDLLSPEETAERIPILDPTAILGSYFVPSDGVARATLVTAALMAEAKGIPFHGQTTVTGFDIHDGRVHGVRTDKGDIECEGVVVCAGIWGPTIGRMAGVPIPLAVVQHQLVWTEPLPELTGDAEEEIIHPILRDQDFSLYFRQRGDRYALGNYRHEPILFEPDDLRPYHAAEPQPSVEPFTPEHFEVAYEESTRLLPAVRDRVDFSTGINGMFSFTPDMGSVVGESADVRGFWICEAVWVTHAGGMGRMAAEWIAGGEPSMDLAEADANRFYPFMTTRPYVRARGAQQYREVYDILHPLQQMTHPRELKLTPFYARHRELGAEFFSGAGWERPQWFEANHVLAGAAWESRTGWAAQNWSPCVGVEHIATRERVAMFDITPFAKFDITGADALSFLERISANRIDRPVGTVVYTSMLTPSGGIRCDLTVTRKDEDRFRVVTGGGSGQHDRAWLLAQRREGERVNLTVRTGSLFALGLWGPKARDVLQAVTDVDVSNDAFPYMTARYLDVGEVGPVWTQRISYAGELGWELYGQIAMGQRAWDVLWEAGQEHGIVAAGGGAFDSLRLEKGYRLWGQDIHTEHDPFEAGLGFAVRMDKDEFQGREALQRKLDRGPNEKLACMTFDDPISVVMGKEPIWHEGRVVSYVTSAAYGYSIGRGIVYGYLPVNLAVEGTPVEVEYFGDRLAATVVAEPLWDPKGERLRA